MGSEGNNPIFLLHNYRVKLFNYTEINLAFSADTKMHCIEYVTFYNINSWNGLKFNIQRKSK